MTSEFLELLDMEIQNRAFALKSAREVVKLTSDPEAAQWHKAWIEFEEFNQAKYAPIAQKYEISQEPRLGAKLQAGFVIVAGAIFSDDITLKTMLDQTIKYLERLKELAEVAPEEDNAFFGYVVEQEEMQIEALRLRIDGKISESVALIRQFVASN